MKLLVWMAALLAFANGLAARADSMTGVWTVRTFTTRTATLDGKTFKGPFEEHPKAMTLNISATKYVSVNDGKKVEYKIRPDGSGYLLTREDPDGQVRITLSSVRRTATRLIFTSTRRNTRRREMTIVRWDCVPAKRPAAAAPSLPGTRWELVEIAYNDDKVLRPASGESMTVNFFLDGKVSGMAGINRFNGTYTADKDGVLKVGPLASTRAANPPGSIADTFLKEVRSARRYLFADGMLVLQLPFDTGIVRFRKAP